MTTTESTEYDILGRVITYTRYNAESNPLVSMQKSLISNLSDTLKRL